MRAAKHLGRGVGKKRLLTLEGILKQPSARDALDRLGPNIDKEKLLRFLRWVAVNWELRRSPRSHWSLFTGMERHTLRRFPDAVRAFASKVELTNRHPLLNLETISTNLARLVRLTKVEREVWSLLSTKWVEFEKLPSLLRTYADFVEVLLRAGGKAIVKNRRMLDTRKMVECALLEYVRRCTGEYHLVQVATLLNAACWECGVEEANYAPLALDAARKRTPRVLKPFVKALSEC